MRVERTGPTGLMIEIASEAETGRLGRAIARVAGPGRVIGLVGTLGAGKTRLVRALAEASGVDPRAISSPTFVLIHEYEGHLPIYHFDVYRLRSPEEFDSLGASDYWADGEGLCLVEWADLVEDRLPDATWWVRIALAEDGGRSVRIETPGCPRAADGIEADLGPGASPGPP